MATGSSISTATVSLTTAFIDLSTFDNQGAGVRAADP